MLSKIILLMIFAYLIGSIPFGFLLGKIRGIDIRNHGSCNIGATNAGRVLGRKYFILVLLLDAAKGFLPTFAAGKILFQSDISHQYLNLLWLLTAFFAISGHNWPVWLKFKGGKGVATSLGVVLAIYPYYTYPGLIAFLCWILVFKITGYVSLGSIIAAGTFLASYIFFLIVMPTWKLWDQWPLLIFSSLMMCILFARHWSNILRLQKGTENKFSLESK